MNHAGLITAGCLGFIIVLVLGTVLNGVALMFLWTWFMVTSFSLPALSIGQALGLSSLVSFMTYQYIDCKPDDSTKGGAKIVLAVLSTFGRPIVALIFGRIIYFLTYGM